MTKANYHCHSSHCDGEGEPMDYAETALARGLSVLGFTAHAPLPFASDWCLGRGRAPEALPLYERAIRRLAAEYGDRLRILAGLEVDYLPGLLGPADPVFAGFEYRLGAVHFLRVDGEESPWAMDSTPALFAEGLKRHFGGKPFRLVETYFAAVRGMLASSKPDVVAHVDLVKKFNRGGRFFDEEDRRYRANLEETLRAVAASGAILEINTGGMARGWTAETYPSPGYFPLCRRLGIPIVLGSDSHRPESVDHAFRETARLLSEAGYREFAEPGGEGAGRGIGLSLAG